MKLQILQYQVLRVQSDTSEVIQLHGGQDNMGDYAHLTFSSYIDSSLLIPYKHNKTNMMLLFAIM